jgi:hypothetical protein
LDADRRHPFARRAGRINTSVGGKAFNPKVRQGREENRKPEAAAFPLHLGGQRVTLKIRYKVK